MLLLGWVFTASFGDCREAEVSGPCRETLGPTLPTRNFAKVWLWLEISNAQHIPQKAKECQGLWGGIPHSSNHIIIIKAVIFKCFLYVLKIELFLLCTYGGRKRRAVLCWGKG